MAHNLNDLQELSKTYHHVSLEKTRTQHRVLTHYLPLYFTDCPLPLFFTLGMVVELAHRVPDTGQYDATLQGRICSESLELGWPQGR